MTTHSSILAWKIPWIEEPGRLQSMGSQRVRHDWVTEHAHIGFPLLCNQSVEFSRSVISDSLQPHALQHTRLPCPLPTPGVYSNSCPSSQWWTSNHLILCHPLLLPSVFPSSRVFSSESVCIRWPKYWSFSFSISPSNEYSGLISFRTDWFALLAIQGTLKSLL